MYKQRMTLISPNTSRYTYNLDVIDETTQACTTETKVHDRVTERGLINARTVLNTNAA